MDLLLFFGGYLVRYCRASVFCREYLNLRISLAWAVGHNDSNGVRSRREQKANLANRPKVTESLGCQVGIVAPRGNDEAAWRWTRRTPFEFQLHPRVVNAGNRAIDVAWATEHFDVVPRIGRLNANGRGNDSPENEPRQGGTPNAIVGHTLLLQYGKPGGGMNPKGEH